MNQTFDQLVTMIGRQRIALLLCIVFAVLQIGIGESDSIAAEPAEPAVDDEGEGDIVLPPVDWALLDFENPADRRIQHLELVIYKSWDFGEIEEALRVATDDALTLKRAMRGMNAAAGYREAEGAWHAAGSVPRGHIHVRATDGEFTIYLEGLFRLEEETSYSRAEFFSWSLAKVVDDMVWQKTGRHISTRWFKSLSGESRLDREKRTYEDEEPEELIGRAIIEPPE